MNEAIKKNLLDLEHSENLSRGITEISIATGGFITILSMWFNKNWIVAIVVAMLFSILFLVDGTKKLGECKKIRDNIQSLFELKGNI